MESFKFEDGDGATVAAETYVGREGYVDGLAERGLACEVVGITPTLRTERGLEIQAWMTENGVEPSQMVILDDEGDMAHLLPRLVRTSFVGGGLQDEHIEQALRLFAPLILRH